MSFWIYNKDKSGRTILWQIDIAIPLLMMMLAALLAVVGPNLFQNPSIVLWVPFVFSGAGFILLFISKLSLYRKGIYNTFGPGHMTKTYATLYKVGYVLIGLGVLLLLSTWTALQRA